MSANPLTQGGPWCVEHGRDYADGCMACDSTRAKLAAMEMPANDNAPAPRARRRSPRLRVVQPLQLPSDWEMKPGVPATRADCANVPRPCPYVSCRHHLWLRLQQEQPGNPQAGKQGETTFRPSSMQSCSLDVADRGAAAIEEIAELLGMDPTRVRQIEQAGLDKLRAAGVDVDELEAQQ